MGSRARDSSRTTYPSPRDAIPQAKASTTGLVFSGSGFLRSSGSSFSFGGPIFFSKLQLGAVEISSSFAPFRGRRFGNASRLFGQIRNVPSALAYSMRYAASHFGQVSFTSF